MKNLTSELHEKSEEEMIEADLSAPNLEVQLRALEKWLRQGRLSSSYAVPVSQIRKVQQIILDSAKDDGLGERLNPLFPFLTDARFPKRLLKKIFTRTFLKSIFEQSCSPIKTALISFTGNLFNIGMPFDVIAFFKGQVSKLLSEEENDAVSSAALELLTKKHIEWEVLNRNKISALIRSSKPETSMLALKIYDDSLDVEYLGIRGDVFITQNSSPEEVTSTLSKRIHSLSEKDDFVEPLLVGKEYMKQLQFGLIRPDLKDIASLLQCLLINSRRYDSESQKYRWIYDILRQLLEKYCLALCEPFIPPSIVSKEKKVYQPLPDPQIVEAKNITSILPFMVILQDYPNHQKYYRPDGSLPIPVEYLLAAAIGLTYFPFPSQALTDELNIISSEFTNLVADLLYPATEEKEWKWAVGETGRRIRELHRKMTPRLSRKSPEVIFPDTDLGRKVKSYSQDRSNKAFSNVLAALRQISTGAAELDLEILQNLWETGRAYVTKCKQTPTRSFSFAIGNSLHNLANQTEKWSLSKSLLINKFLAVPHAITAHYKDTPEQFDLEIFLQRFKTNMERDFGCPGSITIKLQPGIMVWFDKERLNAVLENCISNAIRSVEEYNRKLRKLNESASSFRKPEIFVGATRKPEEAVVEIVVEDNGTGLYQDPGKAGRGVGTLIILEFVKNEGNGKVRWENKNRFDQYQGARVILSIPIKGVLDAENIPGNS